MSSIMRGSSYESHSQENHHKDELWWGYEHINSMVHAKRYFDEKDIFEAKESDFIKNVSTRFWASSRKNALEQLLRKFKAINNVKEPRVKLSF